MMEQIRQDLSGVELEVALDHAHDAIMIRDLDDRIVFWNKGAERLYGWRAHEAAGRNIYDLLLQKDLPGSNERAQTLAERGEWLGELRQVAKDNRDIVVHSRWKLIRDSAGRPQSVLIVNADITEKKMLERRLFGAQRMETIGRLASGIAHDLSNALVPVRMATRALHERHWDNETALMIESLQGGTAYATSLIAQLLSFGKGIEEERISVQPGYLIKEFVRVLRSAFPASIEIKTAIDPDVWTITANVTHLHQVVMNTCVNARDAMPDGGRLTIAVKNVVLKRSPAKYVCIRFSDTGRGIPPEIMGKIMDPFFSTKDPENGMGLGLFIVSRIVNEHNGFIEVSSEVGKETHFDIYLPSELQS